MYQVECLSKPVRRTNMDCIYLHGFASGPKSEKAIFFSERLRKRNVDVDVPDLNLPSFQKMTLSSQIKIAEELLRDKAEKSVLLFGSSMGGLISTLLALKNPAVAGLVLLAPGFGLERRWQTLWGDDALERWRRDGYLEVHHYAYDKEMKLDVDFLDDAFAYQTDGLIVSVPTLLVHGQQDDVVPVEESRRFAAENPGWVDLHVLDDDHFLMADLEGIWSLVVNHLDGKLNCKTI